MKEMIIREDVRTEEAFELIEAGDTDRFREILQNSTSADDPYGLESLTQGLSNFAGASSLGSNTAHDMFSFECEGSGSWMDPVKEEPAVRKENDMFQLDMDESRSPEVNPYAYRVHKDSLAAIEGDMSMFSSGDKNSLLAVFDDDYREESLFGQEFMSNNHSMPIGIPNRDRNNSYLSHMSTSPRNQFERKLDPQTYLGAKPKSRVRQNAAPNKSKKPTKKNQVVHRKKENGRIQRSHYAERPVMPYSQTEELPPDLIDRAGADGRIGAYAPAQRRELLEKFLAKRLNRTWKKRVKYDVRKNFADSRLRVKGRFVKKEDEETLRELMLMTI